MRELRERLHDRLDESAERPADPGGGPWSVFVAMHPDAGRR
jgi:hypothetical protein